MKNIMKKVVAVIASVIVMFGFFYAESYLIEKIFPKTIDISDSECVRYDQNFWIDEFKEYFKIHNMNQKIRNLKKGMDKISVDYVNQYMKNSKYWNKCINLCRGYSKDKLWTKYDKELFREFELVEFPALCENLDFHHFLYKNIYGMKDLPQAVLDDINGKDIIDAGAWRGDTAYTFHKYFPQSHIYAYESIKDFVKEINLMLNELKKEDSNYTLIHPIQKGIGDDEYITEMEYGEAFSDNVEIVSLDYEYPQIGNNNLGLIKIDIEGMESAAIRGAQNIIKQYKPVLVISIYHTPEDFFEMKDKIKALNPDYKFMIRRAEDYIPDADLVLIAY